MTKKQPLNLNFDDTSDVSDEAIQWAIEISNGVDSVSLTRELCAHSLTCRPKARILLARCIEQHYPELLVDPDLIEAREIAARQFEIEAWSNGLVKRVRKGEEDRLPTVQAVLTAIKRYKNKG